MGHECLFVLALVLLASVTIPTLWTKQIFVRHKEDKKTQASEINLKKKKKKHTVAYHFLNIFENLPCLP